jgi:starvation-inducible DNA-binding protein
MQANLGLPEHHRQETGLLLNRLLADEYTLYTKTKNYHWNVESFFFHQLHPFFDAQAEELEDIIDEVAERIRALGHFAAGSLKDFLSLTRLLKSKDDQEEAARMIARLLSDHETIIHQLRKDIDTTTRYGDAGTSDFLTGVLEKHEKMAWMLRAHLPGKRVYEEPLTRQSLTAPDA